jgi:energy-coupling factor transport system ATP-binding protein
VANPFFEAKHLSFSYDTENEQAYPVLRDFSLTVNEGEFVAILGHNGSGKSTLAKLFNMILTPTQGELTILGKDVCSDDFSEDDLFSLRGQIGMVFQNPDNQLVATVVEEDVAFGPENLGVDPAEIRLRVDDALKTVHMEAFASHAPNQLSGGQKQRVAIAGALAMQPKCIIFDESTAMLDPQGRKDMMRTIHDLHKNRNMTVLLITHHMDEAVQAERVVVMQDGELYLDGTPKEVFSQVQKLRMAGLDVPQVTELFFELRESGIALPPDIFTAKEGAECLLQALNMQSN